MTTKRKKKLKQEQRRIKNLEIEKQEKKDKIKKWKEEDSKGKIIQVLNLLNNCFTINKKVKKLAYKDIEIQCNCNYDPLCKKCSWEWKYIFTQVDYDISEGIYKDKNKLINTSIYLIKKNNLPIKYWFWNDEDWNRVIFFQYCWRQVSFHDKDKLVNCKQFNWVYLSQNIKWIPFAWAKKFYK